jgi:hypothetical protein
MSDHLYNQAVDQYKAWLKTPEGINASPEQQRLKRRSLFTATHRAVDPGEDLLRRRESFINSPQAANVRRMYEFTRRARPNLSAKGAFNVMVSQHPNLIKDLTPEQLKFLVSRYVTQDPRRRGTDAGVSNSVYDSNLNPAENPSALRRAAYSGILNFTTNVGKPVVEGLAFIPDLGAKALGGTSRLLGLGLDLAGKHNAAKHFDDAGRYLSTATPDLINYLVPTKTNEADAARGDVNFDWFNRGTRATSNIVGGLLSLGGVGAAKSSGEALRLVAQSPGLIKAMTGPVARHPWVSGLTSAGFLYSTLSGAGSERTATDTDLYGFTEKVAPNGVRVVMKAPAVEVSPDGHIISNGAQGSLLAANNPGLDSVIKRLPSNHPTRVAAENAVRKQYKDISDALSKGTAAVISNDGKRRLATLKDILLDDNIPTSPAQTSTTNPDNPAPAGSPPPSTSDEGAGDNKVSWWDSVDKSQLWKGGTAVGLGLLGLTAGGWKGLLSAGILGGLGYAYGDKLPGWWDDFMKAVNTK